MPSRSPIHAARHRRLCLCLLLGLAAGALQAAGPTAGSGIRPTRVWVGVRSNLSSGTLSLSEWALQARLDGVEGVVFTDDLYRGLHLAMPGLPYTLWLAWQRPSVLAMGPGQYLAAVDAAGDANPGVILIPGFSVAPRYVWSGGPLSGFVCRDWDRRLGVVGLQDPALCRRLPFAAGFVAGRDDGWIAVSRALLAAVALAVASLLLLPQRLAVGQRRRRKGLYRAVIFVFVLVPLLALSLFFNVVANDISRLHVWTDEVSSDAPQQVLDAVNKAGLFQYWSALDESVTEAIPPVIFDTPAAPGCLALTFNQNAFGCLGQSGALLHRPGGPWDRRLIEYVRDALPTPIWAVGEVPAVWPLQGTATFTVENVLFPQHLGAAALVEALDKGAFYARRQTAENSLSIDVFTVNEATFGATVESQGDPVEVRIAISAAQRGTPVHFVLVQDGKVILADDDQTPVQRKLKLPLPPRAAKTYFRLVVDGPEPLVAVGQPVFVTLVSGTGAAHKGTSVNDKRLDKRP